DAQRLEPLIRRFREQGVLRNPPIVSRLPNHGDGEQFMVLDGANRATAARAAGLPHVVVQVVAYEAPHVQLSTWHHALSAMSRDEFERRCAAIDGLEIGDESVLHARALLARRETLAYAVYAEGSATSFRGGRTLEERNHLLNRLVDVYREQSRFYRV